MTSRPEPTPWRLALLPLRPARSPPPPLLPTQAPPARRHPHLLPAWQLPPPPHFPCQGLAGWPLPLLPAHGPPLPLHPSRPPPWPPPVPTLAPRAAVPVVRPLPLQLLPPLLLGPVPAASRAAFAVTPAPHWTQCSHAARPLHSPQLPNTLPPQRYQSPPHAPPVVLLPAVPLPSPPLSSSAKTKALP